MMKQLWETPHHNIYHRKRSVQLFYVCFISDVKKVCPNPFQTFLQQHIHTD